MQNVYKNDRSDEYGININLHPLINNAIYIGIIIVFIIH